MIRRRVPLVGAVAASLVLTFLDVPGRAAGEVSSIAACAPETSRIAIPGNFVVQACFNGSTLFLRSDDTIVLRVDARGDVGTATRSVDGPTPPALAGYLNQLTTLDNVLVPGTVVQVPIGQREAFIHVAIDLDANRRYALQSLLLSYLPLPRNVSQLPAFYDGAAEMARSVDTALLDLQKCMNSATNVISKAGCKAGAYWDINYAITRFAARVLIDVPGLLVKMLIASVWYQYDAYGQGKALDRIARSSTDLHITAAPAGSPVKPPVQKPPVQQPPVTRPKPEAPALPVGPLAFRVTGTCTSAGGTLESQSGNFTPGRLYTIAAWYPDGRSYPLGSGARGTARGNGTVVWRWPCAGDPAGQYATELVDTATGRSTGRVNFTIAAPPTAPPTHQNPPPAKTWREQQGSRGANSFSNPHNASGMGPRIEPYAWVDVSCKLHDPTIESVNPDGYWYRIASAPWNNAYYIAANTFWNGDVPGQTSYTHNTDFAVRDC